jgi:hypothetical protein
MKKKELKVYTDIKNSSVILDWMWFNYTCIVLVKTDRGILKSYIHTSRYWNNIHPPSETDDVRYCAMYGLKFPLESVLALFPEYNNKNEND